MAERGSVIYPKTLKQIKYKITARSTKQGQQKQISRVRVQVCEQDERNPDVCTAQVAWQELNCILALQKHQ